MQFAVVLKCFAFVFLFFFCCVFQKSWNINNGYKYHILSHQRQSSFTSVNAMQCFATFALVPQKVALFSEELHWELTSTRLIQCSFSDCFYVQAYNYFCTAVCLYEQVWAFLGDTVHYTELSNSGYFSIICEGCTKQQNKKN